MARKTETKPRRQRQKQTTLQDRVLAQMALNNLRQYQVVAAGGMSQPALSHIMKGTVKSVDMINIFRLADALGCDPRWLATGEQEEEDKK